MDILKQLVELDKSAAAATDSMIEEEQRALQAQDNKRLSRREKRVAEEREKLEALRSEHQSQLEDKQNNADKALCEATARLDSIFEQHSERWQNEIISRITGV